MRNLYGLLLDRHAIEYDIVDFRDVDAVARAIRPDGSTKVAAVSI